MSDEKTIKVLAAKVRDTDRPVSERRAALSLIAKLRNETYTDSSAIPEEDLAAVIAAVINWPDGIAPLTLAAASDALKEGRQRRSLCLRR